MRWRPALLALVVMIVTPGTDARGGGVRDLDDAWLLDGPRTDSLLAGPVVAGSSPPRWWLEARQGVLYGLPELTQLGLLGSLRQGRHNVLLSWERLGQGLYREDIAVARLLRGDAWRLGMHVELARLELAGDSGRRNLLIAACVQLPLGAGVDLTIDWPWTGPPSWHGDRGLRRWIMVAGRTSATAWAVALHRRGDGTPTLQAEALFSLAPGMAWGARWDAASGSAGFCTAWKRAGLVLRSSHLAHDDLGITHRWSLGVAR